MGENSLVGYIAALIAVLFFGSNWVPLKKLKIEDGIFFQFCMCCGIFITSIPVQIIQNFPPMHGLALVGGILWCTGNLLCPLAIRYIGLGMGLLVWGSINMLLGWASGRFGLFGLLHKDEIANTTLNSIGVCLAMVGLVVYLQVETNDTSVDAASENLEIKGIIARNSRDSKDTSSVFQPLVNNRDYQSIVMVTDDGLESQNPQPKKTSIDNDDTSVKSKNSGNNRVLGLMLACTAGVLFGVSFDPMQYVNDHNYGGNDNTLNYVFTHYCGILMASWFYLIIYCMYKYYHNQVPYVSADCILPATISGMMWGIAGISWFIANGSLGFSVSFPIITSGPGFIGALWGVFVFKEITGTKNLATLALAVCITIPALIMVGLSH
eukprot:gene5955-8208_t